MEVGLKALDMKLPLGWFAHTLSYTLLPFGGIKEPSCISTIYCGPYLIDLYTIYLYRFSGKCILPAIFTLNHSLEKLMVKKPFVVRLRFTYDVNDNRKCTTCALSSLVTVKIEIMVNITRLLIDEYFCIKN